MKLIQYFSETTLKDLGKVGWKNALLKGIENILQAEQKLQIA